MSVNLRTRLKGRLFRQNQAPLEKIALTQILLVDDDDLIRDILASYIEYSTGVVPIQANNATEALSYLQSHPMQLLITDTNMPKMNGVDLLLKAKKLDPIRNLPGSEIRQIETQGRGSAIRSTSIFRSHIGISEFSSGSSFISTLVDARKPSRIVKYSVGEAQAAGESTGSGFNGSRI